MPPDSDAVQDRLRIGISSCLLGDKVRFDGEHKREPFLVEGLGPFVEFVRVCPEVEVGMGVPRESVRLVKAPEGPRMLGNRSGEDWTDRMNALAERRAAALGELDGYVLKSKSPSCGMERVKLYDSARPGSMTTKKGVGLFAAALMRQWPNLPVEEEGRLHDPVLRETFVERIFPYHRLRALWRGRWNVGALVAFHTAHKMQLRAHSLEGYRGLGRLVAGAKALPRPTLRERYEAAFMATLARPATPGRNADVLMHMIGHLRDGLDKADRDELLSLIDEHRRGLTPLVVPLTLIRHHVRRLQIAYLDAQSWLEPHPRELMLRNHA